MNTFKRKSLYAALAGVGALGVTGAAQAVNLNPNGLGQALIYPYYTTRADAAGNAYSSLLSVVNTTSSAKAVKVRFLEGKNSREVLDFNLFLSKFDVWTAAILPSSSGGAKVGTFDKSCTVPPLPAGGKDFVNFAYVGNYDDKGGATLDRTKEGYVEIIEMASFAPNTCTSDWVTHDSTGTPEDCAALVADGPSFSQVSFDASSLPGPGQLFGGMTLINVTAGTDFTEDAVALENFVVAGTLLNPPGNIKPDLRDADLNSRVIANNNVYTSFWPPVVPNGNPDPVSAVLMHDQVMNEYVLDAATHSGTDWVVTFPTKRYYANVGTGNAPKLFQRNFNKTDGSCDDVTLNIYDREEQTTNTPIDFSPPPPTATNSLCWEANVITFNNSNVLGSVNTANIPTSFEHGWLNLGFPLALTLTDSPDPRVHTLPNSNTSITNIQGSTSTGQSVTYFGLPVIGFAVQTFVNGNVGGVLSNYGGNFIHKYTTEVF